MAMPTLKQRVKRLENDFMELSVHCRKQAAEHAYDAMQMTWDKIDAMSDRLLRVELVAAETRADVGILKRQMGVVTIRLDRIDGEISRLDRNVEALNVRFEHLTQRVDGLHDRVDHLTQRVDGLSDRVDGLTERVDGLTQRVDTLNERVDGLTQRFDDLTKRVDGLNDRVDGLSDRMDRMAASNAAMFEAILERLDGLSAQVRHASGSGVTPGAS
ncbi:hypothetical protein [Microbispora sp. H10949]|uniref:hypothetical protein n=1 Tax=Microbispora sp. H10949 TaxID=2729111 RepID=UPI0016010ED9|nr:hypothetical protein [Microbispora sp. H10949]